MTRNSEITRAVRRTPILSAVATAGASLPIHAQDQPAQSPPVVETVTVTVTGSRIASPNQTSISPVTVLSGEDIVNTGRTCVEWEIPKRSFRVTKGCSLYYTGQKVVRSDKNPRGEWVVKPRVYAKV